jgi:hypothetical protein
MYNSKFLEIVDADTNKKVLVNREHIVALHQVNSNELTVSLSIGENIRTRKIWNDFVQLVETGSPFEQPSRQNQG